MKQYENIIRAVRIDSESESALADLLFQCEQCADKYVHYALNELKELAKLYEE